MRRCASIPISHSSEFEAIAKVRRPSIAMDHGFLNRREHEVRRGDSDDDSLAALMRDAQAGDGRAYARLLNAVTPRLRGFLRAQRRFLSADDVEDLLQEVLLSLHAVLATYDPRRPFMPWLLAIARNRLADNARRFARHSAHEVYVAEVPSDIPYEDDAGEYRDPQALKQAIQGLPRGQRQAIEMLKLREMSLREASAASGVSTGSLKVSVHRAMHALRKALVKA
jgi:RNA polymerase sigma factor (sigma-70 family)